MLYCKSERTSPCADGFAAFLQKIKCTREILFFFSDISYTESIDHITAVWLQLSQSRRMINVHGTIGINDVRELRKSGAGDTLARAGGN